MKAKELAVYCSLAIGCLLLASCEKFYPDPIDPRLPVYSESGLRQAGAIVDGLPYVDYVRFSLFGGSRYSQIDVFDQDSIQMILFITEKTTQNKSLIMNITIRNLGENDWEMMQRGHGKRFALDNPSVQVVLSPPGEYWEYLPVERINGQITLKMIPGPKIMAGTFGFNARNPDGPTVRAEYGRYDYFYTEISK